MRTPCKTFTLPVRAATLRAWVAMSGCALVVLGASGQADPRDLVRLDAGRQDTGPLAWSTRVFPTDLRAPMGFEHVYRDPSSESSLVRISGGLAATFPRSQYDVSRYGTVPVIPAGTVFRIGLGESTSPFVPRYGNEYGFTATEARLFASSSLGLAPTAVDTRAEVRRPQPARAADPSGERSIWDDEFYRTIRVRTLLGELGSGDDGASGAR